MVNQDKKATVGLRGLASLHVMVIKGDSYEDLMYAKFKIPSFSTTLVI